MTDTHTIKGKPLAEASDDDLRAEYDAGQWLDCQEGLTPDQEARLLAVEAEMAKRSDAGRVSSDK